MAIVFLSCLEGHADGRYDRCLLEATAKNSQDYNCSTYLQRQDENIALSANDRAMYSQCLKIKEQAAEAAAQKCKEDSARVSNANADLDLLNDEKPETIDAKDKAKPKDQSRLPTTTTPKKSTTAQTSTPKADKTSAPATTSVADAQAQIRADLDQCVNLQSQASRCCGNPLNCAGSMNRSDQQSLAQLLQSQNQQPGQSMTDYCNQLSTQSANTGSVNRALAQVCSSPQTSCVSTCDSLANKYLNLASQNHGNNLESVYLSAADQLASALSTCETLASRANQLAAQGISSGSTQSMSQACQQATAANPATMTTPTGNPVATSPTQAALDATVNCQANPNAPECKPQSLTQSGSSGFDTQAKGDAQFDVPDVGTRSTDYFANNSQPQSAAAKVNAVPNNSGGGFGIGDGGSTSASLNSRGGRRASPGSPGYTTDIMQGTMSGGGYSYGSGSGSGFENQNDSRFFGGRNKRTTKNDDGGMLGMDLRQFLPGGSRARRALAGFNGHSEINAKEEDIWRRISNKMVEKCKLGVLWRCE